MTHTKSMMGIIIDMKHNRVLGKLAKNRSFGAVHFGGRYRLIDFPLSNMVNSGITNVGVFISNKSGSLIDHIGSGKEWSLDRKWDGIHFLPLFFPNLKRKELHLDLNNFYHHIDFLERSEQGYVIMAGTSIITGIDYRDVLSFHTGSGADITVVSEEVSAERAGDNEDLFLEKNGENRVRRFYRKSREMEKGNLFLEMIVMKKEYLIRILESCEMTGEWDLVEILKDLAEEGRIYAYDHKGYVANMFSSQNFFNENLSLLQKDKWLRLSAGLGDIYTKIMDGPPADYRETAEVGSILAGSGCEIHGKVHDSVLFRNVYIGREASVKNAVVMPGCYISDRAVVENVILDSAVTVSEGIVLKGDANRPLVVEKKQVI